MTDERPRWVCARWPGCECRELCDYWSGDGLQPVEEADPDD